MIDFLGCEIQEDPICEALHKAQVTDDGFASAFQATWDRLGAVLHDTLTRRLRSMAIEELSRECSYPHLSNYPATSLVLQLCAFTPIHAPPCILICSKLRVLYYAMEGHLLHMSVLEELQGSCTQDMLSYYAAKGNRSASRRRRQPEVATGACSAWQRQGCCHPFALRSDDITDSDWQILLDTEPRGLDAQLAVCSYDSYKDVWEDLSLEPERGRGGVQEQSCRRYHGGAVISSLRRGGQAYKAGARIGWRIESVNEWTEELVPERPSTH